LLPWLERLTAAVLLAVVLALGWMVAVSYKNDWLRVGGIDDEVLLILSLLAAALLLVSTVALLHTRS
jgi:hypothetical protein